MEKIVLWTNVKSRRPRKVRLMNKDQYEMITELILTQLKQRDTVSLMNILEQSIVLTTKEIGTTEIYSSIILVKNDLVARGILKISFNPDRSQTIELKQGKVKNF